MVLAAPRRAETRVMASRFIATACPAVDESSARAVVASVQAEFPDATHHCWAWRVVDDGDERAHDAGEPAGTAGPPILQAIRSAGLSGLVVVVSRYFGGTKLALETLTRGAARLDPVPPRRG